MQQPVGFQIAVVLQGCPFCRKVREAASILDIDVLFYPCPAGGPTWRPKVIAALGLGSQTWLGFWKCLSMTQKYL